MRIAAVPTSNKISKQRLFVRTARDVVFIEECCGLRNVSTKTILERLEVHYRWGYSRIPLDEKTPLFKKIVKAVLTEKARRSKQGKTVEEARKKLLSEARKHPHSTFKIELIETLLELQPEPITRRYTPASSEAHALLAERSIVPITHISASTKDPLIIPNLVLDAWHNMAAASRFRRYGLSSINKHIEMGDKKANYAEFIKEITNCARTKQILATTSSSQFHVERIRLLLLMEIVKLAQIKNQLNLLPSLSEMGIMKSYKTRTRGKDGKPEIRLESGETLHLNNKKRYGEGTHAKVKSGLLNGRRVAVKRIRIDNSTKAAEYLSLIESAFEIALTKHIFESGVPSVKILDHYLYEDGKPSKHPDGDRPEGSLPKVAIVMEEALKTANSLIRKVNHVTKLEMLTITSHNLLLLQKLGFVQNDFKITNLLLTTKSETGSYSLVLCDFGLSIPLDSSLPIPRDFECLGGSYPVPEGLGSTPIAVDRKKVDVFCLGMMIYSVIQMITDTPETIYNASLYEQKEWVCPDTGTKTHPSIPILKDIHAELDTLIESDSAAIAPHPKSLKQLARIAKKCTLIDPKERCSIDEAYDFLNRVFESEKRTQKKTD